MNSKKKWHTYDDIDDNDDIDDEAGDDSSSSRTILHSGLEGRDYDSDGPRTKRISSTNKVNRQLLTEGSIIEVTYDYGTTITLYLKKNQ